MEGNSVNLTELIIQISKDVASIKTDMDNFKESQLLARQNIDKEIAQLRAEHKGDIERLEKKTNERISGIQSVQNTLVGEVDGLKKMKEKEDAVKWRTAVKFISAAIAGAFTAKLPDIIRLIIGI